MKKIVVPTNFSQDSIDAVNYAADLACAVGVNVLLLYMYPIPVTVSEVPLSDYSVTAAIEDAKNRINELKQQLEYRTGGRIQVSTQVEIGDLLSKLKEICERIHPYAVVMGAESMNSFERFLVRANTISAIKELSSPVIVVPSGQKFSGIRNIALACDLKNVAHTIPFEEIQDLVTRFRAQLHIIHVLDANEISLPEHKREELSILKSVLGQLNAHYHFVYAQNIDEGITRYSEKHPIDLLIVLPKKHGIVEQIFKHSDSKQVVLHTKLPVLSIHE